MNKFIYFLTDMGRDHFWTGRGFIPVTDWSGYAQGPASYTSRTEANAEVRRLRTTQKMYVKVLMFPRFPAAGEGVSTFAQVGGQPC